MIHTIAEVSCCDKERVVKAKSKIELELEKNNIKMFFKDSKNIIDKESGKTLVERFRVYAQGGGRKNILVKIFESLIDNNIIWGYYFDKE